MTIDPYAPCLCGSGKKLKFCCVDLTVEMDKVWRMLDGDQPAACLQYLSTLIAKQPARVSLLGLKGMIELEMQRYDDARATIDHLLARHPDSVIGLAERASLLAQTGEGLKGIDPLQRAMENLVDDVPHQLFSAIDDVATYLLAVDRVAAGFAHLLLKLKLFGDSDPGTISLLRRLYAARQIPLILRDEWLLSPPPSENTTWKERFEEALLDALHGRWRLAAEKFERLRGPSQDNPAVLRNLALLCIWTADDDRALAALRRFVSREVPYDDALEAETIAVLIGPEHAADVVEQVVVEFESPNLEALEVAIASSPQFRRHSIKEPAHGPPPRATYAILDAGPAPLLTPAAVEQAPVLRRSMGVVRILGRETDRPAHIELWACRGRTFDQAIVALRNLGAECVGEITQEQVFGLADLVHDLMGTPWFVEKPSDTAQARELAQREILRILRDVWTLQPLKALGGRTPAEASEDPALRLRLDALTTLLEPAIPPGYELDLSELRDRLNLPATTPIDPQTQSIHRLPIVRIARVVSANLSDEQLADLWRRASMSNVKPAMISLSREIIGREALRDSNPALFVLALETLSDLGSETDRRLEYLEEARRLAVAADRPAVHHDMIELRIRLDRNEMHDVRRIVDKISAEHGDDPNVIGACLRLLQDYAVIDLTRDAPLLRGAGAEAARAGRPAPERPAIWTPERQRQAQGRSPLWTPGSS